MPRYTVAYSSLISRLDEIALLERKARHLERKDPVNNRSEINALCRAALVLMSSHVEGYIKDLGEVAIDALVAKKVNRAKIEDEFFFHLSQSTFKSIKESNDHGKLSKVLFNFLNYDALHWSKVGPFSAHLPTENFNKGFSNPMPDKIKAYLGRFGYGAYMHDLARSMKSNYQPTINAIEHLVDVRNKIAHGDVVAVKTPQEVVDLREHVQRFCVETDKVFATWFRKKYCSIRCKI
jgi:hypothetical protein